MILQRLVQYYDRLANDPSIGRRSRKAGIFAAKSQLLRGPRTRRHVTTVSIVAQHRSEEIAPAPTPRAGPG